MPKTFLWALLALAIALHVRYYLKVAPELQVYQVSVGNARLHDLLGLKRVLVLDEAVADVRELLRTVFRFMFLYQSGDLQAKPHDAWRTCHARYTILSPQDGEAHVDVLHPASRRDVLRVRLQDHRVLVLPPGYRYKLHSLEAQGSKPSLRRVLLYDWLHLALRPFATVLRPLAGTRA